MFGVGVRLGLKRAALTAALLLATAAVSGCANGSYAGIKLAAGAADPELQSLAASAGAGDKQAQLELGIRYEEGRGVVRNLGRAKWLYAQAAADSGGVLYVYSPPVGKHGSGRVVPVNTGPKRQGLAEARARLRRLK